MKKPSISEIQRIVALSNQIAEYPPTRLTKLQFQALLILISCIDSTEKPVYSIDDIKQEIDDLGITKPTEQMTYLEEFITRQNTFRIPFREYARYFSNGETPRGGVVKRALEAGTALNNRPIEFNNPNFEGNITWFQAIYRDKETDDLVFVITSYVKPFVMGLRRDFLQMLAESTMEFDGKHSIPIFLYMKSKLYDGQMEFHGKESIDEFRARFGLDRVKTYDRFYELERRVLKVASEDSAKSGDIHFTFEGKAGRGSKKITQLYYHIYRSGNIKRLSPRQQEDKQLRQKKHQEKVNQLTQAQHRGYEFLASRKINRSFIINKILPHEKMRYEPLLGYEDIFCRILWKYLNERSKAKKKAGAFVSWWKKGLLTRDDHYWAVVDQFRERIKQLPSEEHDRRAQARSMTRLAYEKLRQEAGDARGTVSTGKKPIPEATSVGAILSTAIPKRKSRAERQAEVPFDFEQFKLQHTAAYKKIKEERTVAFRTTFPEAEWDKDNFQKMLQNSIVAHCEQWWRKQGGS